MSVINDIQENFRRGLTDMLIMCLLTEEDKYGYQLLKELKVRTDGLFDLNTASLYGPLYRLQKNGFVETYEMTAGVKRKRTYYHLTQAGLEHYKLAVEEYARTHYQIRRINNLDANQ